MFRCTVLASGSKGNCTVIRTERTRLVVDAGLSCREIVKRMRYAGEDPEKVDGLLITHEHQDHIQGVSVLARRFRIPTYFTGATHAAWKRILTPRKTMGYAAWLEERKRRAAIADSTFDNAAEDAEELSAAGAVSTLVASAEQPSLLEEEFSTALPALEFFSAGKSFTIGDIAVTPFTIPHDAADPVGFVFEAEGMRIAVATDLGYMPPNVQEQLQRADLLILESNHDVEMLRDGPYPWSVKQRVLSRVGHLSNDAAAEYLSGVYDGHARWVVLAHLSESNNLPELARLSAERALQSREYDGGSQVLLASQTTPLEAITL
jgi:phosphoribosyl 1,2-cyclic phosphodiesterase